MSKDSDTTGAIDSMVLAPGNLIGFVKERGVLRSRIYIPAVGEKSVWNWQIKYVS